MGFDYSPSYIAGLLDATGRVRFQLSDTGDGRYTVRPSLRIFPQNTPMREAVIGSFLDGEHYDYQLVDRKSGANYFSIDYISELEDIHEYLAGHSAHLVRELKFVTTVFINQFDNKILSPREAYRFLLTRDELRYGWRPRAPQLVTLSDIEAEHDFETDEITTPTLPEGSCRSDYSIDYIAGLFDGRCRYRPSIDKSDKYSIGYMMHPIARLYKNGVSSPIIQLFRQFCDDYNLNVSDLSEEHEFGFTFAGSGAIRRVLEVIFPRLIVATEYSAFLDDIVLPRFDVDDHLTKQGFFETLIMMERVAVQSGGHYQPNQYTSEHFAELWSGELDLEEIDPSPSDGKPPSDRIAEESTTSLDEFETVTVSPEVYRDVPGRYQTVINRHQRDRELVEALKELYADRCQLCGDRRARPDGTGYSEVHHIRPLGQPHEGPDKRANMVVVCPNHHADFDNGVLTVNPKTLEIHHPYDRSVDGRTLTVKDDHDINSAYLEYHGERIVTHSEIES